MPKAAYYHIANYGKRKGDVFRDQEDFDTFINYLNEYLNPPVDRKSIKKEFVVKGKVYKGSPRIPKNYYGKVELVTYNLNNKSFSLLLKQNEQNLIPEFIRSLCTRYSIYFNKKYKRTGGVFAGPYRALPVKSDKQLSLLTGHLDKSLNALTTEEYEILNEVLFNKTLIKPAFSVHQEVVITKKDGDKTNMQYLKMHQRIPEIVALGIGFFVLIAIGVTNIKHSNTKPGSVAGVYTQAKTKEVGFARYGEDFEYITVTAGDSGDSNNQQ